MPKSGGAQPSQSPPCQKVGGPEPAGPIQVYAYAPSLGVSHRPQRRQRASRYSRSLAILWYSSAMHGSRYYCHGLTLKRVVHRGGIGSGDWTFLQQQQQQCYITIKHATPRREGGVPWQCSTSVNVCGWMTYTCVCVDHLPKALLNAGLIIS